MARRAKEPTGAMALLQDELPALRRAAQGSVVAGLLWLPQAWIAAQALAALLAGRAPGPLALVLFLALAALRIILSHRAERGAQEAALAAVGRLRARLLTRESLLARPLPAGQAASLVQDQAEVLRPYAARYLQASARLRAIPAAILAASFWIAWAPGLILLVAGPAIPLFMALIGQAAGRASRRQLDQMGTMGGMLADRAAALPDIRLMGAGQRLVAEFTASADELRRRTMQVLTIAFMSSGVLELFAALGVAMMAVFCGFSLLGQLGFGTWPAAWGNGQLDPAHALFLLLIAPEFFQPLRDFAAAWHDRAAAESLAAVVAERQGQTARMAGQGGPARALPGPALRLRGVIRHGIRYPDLDLSAGASVALVGPSGAGKTSLLRMIAGLEQPDAGLIEVAGRPPRPEIADAWRAGLGWMAQAPHFLDASLRENLLMGRAGDPAPALSAALADGVVANLPDGLMTRLGENGAGVSGGEARRLMLARVLIRAPGLILADEPTADLDAGAAAQITQALLAAQAAGAGLVVATHDPALAVRMGQRLRIGGLDA